MQQALLLGMALDRGIRVPSSQSWAKIGLDRIAWSDKVILIRLSGGGRCMPSRPLGAVFFFGLMAAIFAHTRR
jgi:hypothetical protein